MGTRPLGPGPGAYRLPTTVGYPDHDPSRYRNPMYSFGLRSGARVKPGGPGPTYKIDRVTREGNMTSPHWSFGARLGRQVVGKTPGPGAHAPERCPPMKDPRAPAYSMGARLGYNLKRVGPAANAYNIRCGPANPAYTMAARLGYMQKTVSPGPAVYYQKDIDTYQHKQPVYSLGARLDGGFRPMKNPGPAAYPPNLYNIKKNPNAYSFGVKHGDYAPPLIVKEDTMDCL